VVVLGGSTEEQLNSTFFLCFTVSISGGVGSFVPMAMVVERGDATGVLDLWSFSNISVHSQIFQVT
jgi:hypothetical protein